MIGTVLNLNDMRKLIDHMGVIEQPWVRKQIIIITIRASTSPFFGKKKLLISILTLRYDACFDLKHIN